jgi:hypothetical protein
MPERGHLPPELAQNKFFKESDSAQVKYEMLRLEATTKKPVVKVCSEFGYTRKTFYDTKARFEKEGMAGLLDKPAGPKGPRKLTPELEETIVRIKKENPKYKVPQVYAALKEEYSLQGAELNISAKTVERVLIKHGLHTPRVKKNRY